MGIMIQEQNAIECRELTKRYFLYQNGMERLKGLFFPKYRPTLFTALENITLTISKGESLGVIGLNGSGKSTLANILAGITWPTEGEVAVDGDVSFLGASVGMLNMLTGRENIKYKFILLGLPDSLLKEREEEIIDFAGIGEHIDQQVRTYSSGMRARLGFAISVHVDPDILIIDEALSVGDRSFSEKSLAKMEEFKTRNKTILFVSHAVDQTTRFCDRVLWLHRGKSVGIGLSKEVISPYFGFTKEWNNMSIEEQNELSPALPTYQEKYL